MSNNSNTNARNQNERLPLTSVNRIMKQVLPPQVKIYEDARQAVMDCVAQFMNLLTIEAKRRCHDERRKIVTAEDVIFALESHGFKDYVEPLTLYLSRYREVQNQRNSVPGEAVGICEAIARRATNYPPASFLVARPPRAFDAGLNHGNAFPTVLPLSVFDPFGALMGGENYGHFGENHGGAGASSSSGQAAVPNLEFYAQRDENDHHDGSNM